ncbi:hypothetical protein EPB69_07730 [Geobacillus stearothermophilus]|nr:hypothetical protein CV945_07800 [Geobacillus sp. Manikaran-105]PJW16657.1 hypothetical protein CV944_13180 [Geobacillus sp. WSUCF-018B]QHN49173.1 hypothetical protein EPB69_07730 [Geobacillus stearothermophilus]RXS89756.1 hypothetical protein ETR37_05905 [Geobacillus sp. PK12]
MPLSIVLPIHINCTILPGNFAKEYHLDLLEAIVAPTAPMGIDSDKFKSHQHLPPCGRRVFLFVDDQSGKAV